MDGVLVHAEHVYREISFAGLVVILFISAAFLSCLVYAVAKKFKEKSTNRWRTAAVLAFSVLFLGFLDTIAVNAAFTIHKDYVVTIEDSVSFNEFYKHYEIVGQDGKLYTIRELPDIEESVEEAGDNA